MRGEVEQRKTKRGLELWSVGGWRARYPRRGVHRGAPKRASPLCARFNCLRAEEGAYLDQERLRLFDSFTFSPASSSPVSPLPLLAVARRFPYRGTTEKRRPLGPLSLLVARRKKPGGRCSFENLLSFLRRRELEDRALPIILDANARE